MSATPLARLARLLPAGRLAWRAPLPVLRTPAPPQARAPRRFHCSAAAVVDIRALPADPTPPEPTDAQAAVAAAAQQAQQRQGRTGAFQRLPMVSPSKELLDSALRRAGRVGPNKKLKNEAQKAKNRAARQLDTLLKELCVPLGKYIKEFPPTARLHPFERALLELTVGPGTYERVLGRVEALRKSTVQVGKAYAARCSKALNKKDAEALQVEGFERMEAVFAKGAAAVDELKEVAKSLRKLPVVDPELPTVALVGAPNVGKSSLVQLLSSGLPEVQNYPFTTRSIKMGHFYVDGRRHQVTDTPGLLNREDGDRNAMERLTLASLQHLPTAVLFVADLTGECGTSVADQWRIREDLRAKFLGKPWLDVLSKADMLEEELDAADELVAQQAQQGGDTAAKAAPAAAQEQQQQQHAAVAGDGDGSSNGSSSSSSSEIGAVAAAAAGAGAASATAPGPAVRTAVDFAAALPGALRVSSLTGDGIEALKGSMLSMLEEAQLAREGLEGWWGEGEAGGPGGGDELIFHDDEFHREHEAYMYD